MAIEGYPKSIRELIMENNLSFHIPIYQRTYTWKAKSEVEKLISDICEFGREYDGHEKANYYVGNVIVKNQSRGFVTERIVIDGQQRITTTILMLCAIRDIYIKKVDSEESIRSAKTIGRALYSADGEVIRLKLNNMEHQETLNTLLSGEIDAINAKDKETNYWKNYHYILQTFKEMTEQELQKFADILERVKVVAIFLDEEQDENSVFESINSAGKPLAGSDLIKNFVFTFRKYDVSHQEEKRLIELYTTKFESNFSGSSKQIEIELEYFFREFIALKTGQKVNKEPKCIYYAFKKCVGEINDLDSCRSLIIELVKWAVIYQTLRSGKHPDIDQNHLGYLRESFMTYATLLMDMVDKLADFEQGSVVVNDKQSLNDAIKKVVVYDVLRFLAGYPAKEITRFVPTISKKLEMKDPNYFRDYATAFERLVTETSEGYRQPNVRNIKQRINDHDLYKNRKQLRRFLVLVENLGQNEVIPFGSELKKCEIEHIMPQTLPTNWEVEISESTHQKYLHTLGNLSITFDNKELGNKGYDEKKRILADRSNIRLNKMLLQFKTFSEKEIQERAAQILHKFLTSYGIDVSEDDENEHDLEIEEFTPQSWLDEVKKNVKPSELNGLAIAKTWKMICDYLNIPVEGDSSHRRLEKWIQHNRPLWPSTFNGGTPQSKNSPMEI